MTNRERRETVRKGRDLFDMWLTVEHGGATPSGIAECFGPYRPTNGTQNSH